MTSLLSRSAALLALPLMAVAHEGHPHLGVVAGLQHPLVGWDHLLAMVTVGLLAARLGGAQRWSLPLTFIVTLLVGAILGVAGVPALPGLEHLIVASVLVLGLVLAARGPQVLPSLVLVGTAGLLHGLAHGAEVPATVTASGYLAGMVVMSAVLHGLGLVAAIAAPRPWLRPVGVAVASLALVIGVITLA